MKAIFKSAALLCLLSGCSVVIHAPSVLGTAPASLVMSQSSWAPIPQQTLTLTAFARYSDGTQANTSAATTWSTPNSSLVSITGSGPQVTLRALGVGTTTVIATDQNLSATLTVTTSSANLIVQRGGFLVSGFARYDATSGALLATLANDTPARDLRGMAVFPGGFVSVGYDPNISANVSEAYTNAGVLLASAKLEQGAWENGPQAVTRLRDGRFLVPQYNSGMVNIYSSSGAYLSQFSGGLASPFQAVELADGRVLVTSFGGIGVADGKVVAFTPSGATYSSPTDFLTGVTDPLAIDYCWAQDRILVSDYATTTVHACNSAGSCSTLVNHGLTQPRALRQNINAGDCSFFVGYVGNPGNRDYIARLRADGSTENANWISMPTAQATRIFQMDFEQP